MAEMQFTVVRQAEDRLWLYAPGENIVGMLVSDTTVVTFRGEGLAWEKSPQSPMTRDVYEGWKKRLAERGWKVSERPASG
jgi:hypothetical protein